MIRRATFAAFAISVLAGCSFTDFAKIPSSTVDFNLAVEKAQNEILLLNILRSAYGRPQYLSEVTQVRGSASISFASGALTYGSVRSNEKSGSPLSITKKATARNRSLAPSASFSMTPTFDVAFPRSKEFISALLSTVDPNVINQLLDMGWDPALIGALVIARFTDSEDKCFRPNAYAQKRKNVEGTACASVSFRELSDRLAVDNGPTALRFAQKPIFSCFGKPIGDQALSDPMALAKLNSAGLVLVDGRKCKSKHKKGATYTAKKSLSWTLTGGVDGCKKMSVSGLRALSDTRSYILQTNGKCSIILRSADAMLYFLGEIARRTIDGREANGYESIFEVKMGETDKKGVFTSVTYLGEAYYIPAQADLHDRNERRPTSTFKLMSLILGLQQSSKELVRTGAVEVVGS